MIKFLKKIAKKSLRFLGLEINRYNNLEKDSNIICSKIHPNYKHLISENAIVQFSEFRGKVSIGTNSLINKVLFDGEIKIGRNTTINGPGTEFYAINNPIKIGNFCSIARNTAIQEHNHNIESITSYFIKYRFFNEPYGVDAVSRGPIIIGNDVWIGTQSTILTGVTIGDGAVVAANSVVTNDVPPYAVVGGTPAKVLKYRFDENIVRELLRLKWWDWEDEKILRNKDIFYGKLTPEKLNNIL